MINKEKRQHMAHMLDEEDCTGVRRKNKRARTGKEGEQVTVSLIKSVR